MPDSPTTEGSIVAYLRLNTSDWDAKLDEAEAKARELGRVDPTIRVSADTAEALAKLEELRAIEAGVGGTTTNTVVNKTVDLPGSSAASSGSAANADAVAAAQARLAAAEQASEMATQRAIVAEMRLNEQRDKGRLSDAQLAAAELALQAAIQRSESAATKAAAAEDALAAAQKKAAESAFEDAAAQAIAASATDKQGTAANNAAAGNKNNLGYMGLIIGAIAAAIPLGSALAGATVAIAGGMAGMGAAGVLAVLGIKNEMAAGTEQGVTYSAGLQVLQSDLKQLESTAANGVLNGFTRSVDTLNADMPQLNSEISVFSGELGTAAAIVTSGVVTALQVLNPLLIDGGVYVEQLAAGFTRWTQDGGLQRFTHDAIQELPQVTDALGSLLNGAMNLIGALAPMGTEILGIVSFAGQLLSVLSMLGPVLPMIAAGGLAAFGAFKGWQALTPIINSVVGGVQTVVQWMAQLTPLTEEQIALSATYTDLLTTEAGVMDAVSASEDAMAASTAAAGTAFDIAAGPVGAILAIVGGVAAAFLAATSAEQAATTATANYTAVVQQDNGAIGQHTQTQIADNLQKTGAINLAKQLGVSTTALVAATGSDDTARKKLVNTLKDQVAAGTKAEYAGRTWINVQDDQAKAAQKLLDIMNQQHGSVTDAVTAYNQVAESMGMSTYKTDAQKASLSALAAQYGMSVPAFLAAQVAQQANASQAQAATQQLQLENDAAGLLTNAFTLLNGGMLSVAQAQTGAAAAGNSLLDSLKQNGTAIDGNSKAAVANQQALEQKAAADQQAAEAIAKQTGSTEAGTKAFATSKQALIDQMKAAGDLTPAIQALIDKYYAVPPVVKTKAELDADAAMAKAAALKAAIEAIHDQTVTLTVVTNSVGAPATMPANVRGGAYKSAHGGPVPQYLAGGGESSFWQPQGTDTVPSMLTPGEFVVKQKSASYDSAFLKAYNDDPARALEAVRSRGKSGPAETHNHFYIYQADNPTAVAQRTAHYLASQGV